MKALCETIWTPYPRQREISGFRLDHRGEYVQRTPMTRGRLVEVLLETIGCEITRDPPMVPATQDRACDTAEDKVTPIDHAQTWLGRYLLGLAADEEREHAFAVFYGDGDGAMEISRFGLGDEGCVYSYMKDIARRAFEIGAIGIVVVHNHPDRNPEPSDDDVKHAEQLARELKIVDLHLMDSWILAAPKITSLRQLGKLPEGLPSSYALVAAGY